MKLLLASGRRNGMEWNFYSLPICTPSAMQDLLERHDTNLGCTDPNKPGDGEIQNRDMRNGRVAAAGPKFSEPR